MEIAFLVVFGLITALLAGRKGYNPGLWFFAAGIIGLVILAFLPFVNEKGKHPVEQLAAKKRTGDITGGVISGFALLVILASLAGR